MTAHVPEHPEQHGLTPAWAFKYDSQPRGLSVHADAAVVNVNFWITPDEANLDSKTGGLVGWNKEATRAWNFKEYNNARTGRRFSTGGRRSQSRADSLPREPRRRLQLRPLPRDRPVHIQGRARKPPNQHHPSVRPPAQRATALTLGHSPPRRTSLRDEVSASVSRAGDQDDDASSAAFFT